MSKTGTFEYSPAADRVSLLLQKKPCTKKDIEAEAFVSRPHAMAIVNHLKEEGEIHITSWKRNPTGKPTPTYAWGKKADAPRPIPMGEKAKHARYRERMRELLGEHYKYFIYALNDPKPGRKIVVEGKVVWEQRSRSSSEQVQVER